MQRLLDLVHAWFNVEVENLLEPAQHFRLHLGAVSRRDLTFTATNTRRFHVTHISHYTRLAMLG